MDFLHSVEFYVILFVVAALVVGIMALPASNGPIETDFTTAKLSDSPLAAADPSARLEVECQPDGTIKVSRFGLPDELTSDATVAIAITRKGFDLTLEERITPGRGGLLDSERAQVNCATFYLVDLAHERYHIKFNSESTSSFTAFSVNNLPGLKSTRPLLQA